MLNELKHFREIVGEIVKLASSLAHNDIFFNDYMELLGNPNNYSKGLKEISSLLNHYVAVSESIFEFNKTIKNTFKSDKEDIIINKNENYLIYRLYQISQIYPAFNKEINNLINPLTYFKQYSEELKEGNISHIQEINNLILRYKEMGMKIKELGIKINSLFKCVDE